MWYLVCRNKDGQSYRLTDRIHKVSRTKGDIILAGDQSVSRLHAEFKVDTSNVDNISVTVTDLSSKYGTYVNGTIKLEPRTEHRLQDGDVVTFGCQWNEWRLHSKPLVVATSTLPSVDKAKLKEVISELGGTLVNDWQESCSFLTMAEISLTAKVVCALASAVPIISPNYWTCFKDALDQHRLPPDPDQFIPPLKESVLNRNRVSFSVNQERRKIFCGKTFVFCCDRQMKKYKNLISAAGGVCKNIADYNKRFDEVCKPDVIFMQNPSILDSQHSEPSQVYASVLRLIKRKGLKPIPESDIGLAILMCSMETYCNPKYNVIESVLEGRSMSSGQGKGGEILASETPNFGSEISMIKTEALEVDERVISSSPSIAENFTQHSSSNSGSMYDERNLGETLPCDQNCISPTDKSSVDEQVISSPLAPTRKRAVAMDVDEPPAKKGPPQTNISSESVKLPQSFNETFHFVDLLSANPSQSETPKRKIGDSSCSPLSLSKKPCLEEKSIKYGTQNTQQTAGTSKEGVLPVSALEEDLSTLKVGSPLTNGKRSYNSEKSWSSKGGPSNLVEWTNDISQNSRINGIEGGLFPSTSKDVSHESVLSFNKPQLSTTKSGNSVANKWEGGGKSKDAERKMFGGCVVVRKETLIVERQIPQVNKSLIADPSVVNFKKFKKVMPVGRCTNALPIIIGDSDLIVFKNNRLL